MQPEPISEIQETPSPNQVLASQPVAQVSSDFPLESPEKRTRKLIVLIFSVILGLFLLSGILIYLWLQRNPTASVWEVASTPIAIQFSEHTTSPVLTDPITPEPTQSPPIMPTKQELILTTFVGKYDQQGKWISDQPKMDFYLTLPSNSRQLPSTDSYERNLIIDDQQYSVLLPSKRNLGLCPWEDDGSGCTYSDEKSNTADILRLWKNNDGIFALNPQSLSIDGYYMDSLIIQKPKQWTFSQEELITWKNILETLEIRPSTQESF